MRIVKVIIIGYLLLNQWASVGQRLITGQIINLDTEQPIENAQIRLIGTDTDTTSNQRGYFQLTVSPSDTLTVYKKGYETLEFPIPELDRFQVGLKKIPVNIFKKGMDNFYGHLAQSLRYPSLARRNDIQGLVHVSFQIDESGKLNNFNIINDLEEPCAKEVIRALKLFRKDFLSSFAGETIILPVIFSLGIPKQSSTPIELPDGIMLSQMRVTLL